MWDEVELRFTSRRHSVLHPVQVDVESCLRMSILSTLDLEILAIFLYQFLGKKCSSELLIVRIPLQAQPIATPPSMTFVLTMCVYENYSLRKNSSRHSQHR
jgi:hypothetical protein